MIVDVPKFWQYLGETSSQLFLKLKDASERRTVITSALKKCIKTDKADKFIASLLKSAADSSVSISIDFFCLANHLTNDLFLINRVKEKQFLPGSLLGFRGLMFCPLIWILFATNTRFDFLLQDIRKSRYLLMF